MKLPRLTVVMPNFNHSRFISIAIQAVLDQTLSAEEILIIDDASTDNSKDIIKKYEKFNKKIKLIENLTNRGVNWNLNYGLEQAQGDYFVGVACDDRVLPHFFESSLSLLAQYPGAGICSGRSRIMNENGQDMGLLPGQQVSAQPAYLGPDEVKKRLVRHGQWMQGNTTIYRTRALMEIGGFRSKLFSFSDNFASQILALRHGACFIPEALGVWRRMPTTYSAKCRADKDIEQMMIDHALNLMTNEFADDFPEGYAFDWKYEMLFERAKMLLRKRFDKALKIELYIKTLVEYYCLIAYFIIKYRPKQTVCRKLLMLLDAMKFEMLTLKRL